MAAGKILLQKASGGVTTITGVDGTGATELQIPESGVLATTANPVFTGNGITIPVLASDPSGAVAGQMYYNSTDRAVKNYDGTSWTLMTNKFRATGGTVTESGGYRIHAFTSSGTFTVLSSGTIDILLVAGGGAGAAAGAGAGGVVFNQDIQITPGQFSIFVGAGGAAQNAYAQTTDSPNHGQNTYTNITGVGIANKGQGAYGWDIQPDTSMNIYGSGCGIGQSSSSGYVTSGYTVGQGSHGGQDGSDTSPFPSGGGGGAGGAGGAGSGVTSGNGGVGVNMSSYFGTSFGVNGWFAGGGAGANHSSPFNAASGGTGGGGSYKAGDQSIRNGLPNTGGGGAGAAAPSSENITGGAGGSGIVLIRYKL